MTKKEVTIPIFRDSFTIVKVRNLHDLNAVYGTRVPPKEYDAVTFISNDDDVIIAFEGKADEPIKAKLIVHEVVHLVNYIFDRLGLVLDSKNDETQAYLTEWLFEQIEEFLNETAKEKSHANTVSVLQ